MSAILVINDVIQNIVIVQIVEERWKDGSGDEIFICAYSNIFTCPKTKNVSMIRAKTEGSE